MPPAAASKLSGGFDFLPPVRFGEAIALAKERMDQKNVYFTNPAFDK